MSDGLLNLLSGRLPAYTRKARHVQLLTRYGTPRKLANIAAAELAKMRGDLTLKSYPYIYTVDVGNVCNLRCPLCPTGTQSLGRTQSFMSLADFEKILEKISPYAIEVVLHNWGEPLLHPEFFDIVRAAKAAGVGTAASSNMNLKNKDVTGLYELVDSGLDHLVLSIDGTTQDVYEQYRRGGNIQNVFQNVKELIAYKKSKGSSTPVIEWQYLVMKQNEHQIEDARRIAEDLGVDELRFTGAGMPFDELANVELAEQWLSTLPEYRNYDSEKIAERGYLYEEKCFYLYRAMTVNPGSEVAPCCAISNAKWDFGCLLHSDLEEVWNGPHYKSARALFSKKDLPAEEQVETVCHVCPLFKYEQPNLPAAPNEIEVAPRGSVATMIMRSLDIVVAAIALLVAAPLMLLIALAIKFDSPGPVLFKHTRVGKNRRTREDEAAGDERRGDNLFGRPYEFYKFRTMYVDARERFPELYNYQYERDDLHSMPIKILVGAHQQEGVKDLPKEDLIEDPRVTRVGRWLRRTSLDELPNFINVLLGDMHLVGPRPDMAANIRYYDERHLEKLRVRPGITGLAQIHGRGNLSFHDTNEWDLEYVATRSVSLDIKILFKTLWVSLRGDGAF